MPNAMTTGWPAWSGAVDRRAGAGGDRGRPQEHRAQQSRCCCWKRRSSNIPRPIPAASPTIPPACARTAGNTATARHGSSTASCACPTRRAPRATPPAAAALIARAFTIFEKISPLKKTDPDNLARYGLAPNQQPADIYDGYGHDGRGGWSWYTGSAARMLSAAYAILGDEDGRRRDRRRAGIV